MKTHVARFVSLAAFSAAAAWGAPAGPAAKTPPVAANPEQPVKIEGMEVARAGGGYLGVAIVGGTFKISFYDAKRKAVAADVVRALLRWDPKYKQGSERVVLTLSGDGKSLASAKAIRPPYAFKLFITLFKDAAETDETSAGEVLVIDFRG